jgi:hypothetical protein
MSNYQLVGVDQMEATKLRRKLDPIDPWDTAKSERVKPVIAEIAKSCGVEITPTEPRWEHGVYPLYYLYRKNRADNLNMILQRIRDDYLVFFPDVSRTCSPNQITKFVDNIANTEVDLLIEDHDYFIFVEAKDPPEGRPARFQIRDGVHQLVLQYAEGLFLAEKIRKKFFLATLGTKINYYNLTPKDQTLLGVLGDSTKELKFCDLSWTEFPSNGNSGL